MGGSCIGWPTRPAEAAAVVAAGVVESASMLHPGRREVAQSGMCCIQDRLSTSSEAKHTFSSMGHGGLRKS